MFSECQILSGSTALTSTALTVLSTDPKLSHTGPGPAGQPFCIGPICTHTLKHAYQHQVAFNITQRSLAKCYYKMRHQLQIIISGLVTLNNASQVTSFVWPTCRTAVHKAENKTQAHTEYTEQALELMLRFIKLNLLLQLRDIFRRLVHSFVFPQWMSVVIKINGHLID